MKDFETNFPLPDVRWIAVQEVTNADLHARQQESVVRDGQSDIGSPNEGSLSGLSYLTVPEDDRWQEDHHEPSMEAHMRPEKESEVRDHEKLTKDVRDTFIRRFATPQSTRSSAPLPVNPTRPSRIVPTGTNLRAFFERARGGGGGSPSGSDDSDGSGSSHGPSQNRDDKSGGRKPSTSSSALWGQMFNLLKPRL
jgi:hypothetical protein